MLIGTRRMVLTLALIGVVDTATAQTPSQVLRPNPTTVHVRYSADLTPDDDPRVTLIVHPPLVATGGVRPRGHHREVEAVVTPEAIVVTLASEISEQLDAIGGINPSGAAFLIIDALTLGGQVQRNLIRRSAGLDAGPNPRQRREPNRARSRLYAPASTETARSFQARGW